MFMSVILRFGYACAFYELVDGCGAKRPCIGETEQQLVSSSGSIGAEGMFY